MEGFEEVRAAPFNPSGDGGAAVAVPLDICREILLRLPAKSLIGFRAVCKSWRAVIDDPRFVRTHTNNHLSSNTILFRNSSGPPFNPLYSFDLETLNFTDGLQTIAVAPLNFTLSGLSRLPSLPVAACNGLILIAPKYRETALEIWNPLTDERLELPRGGNCDSDVVAVGLGYDYATDDYKAVVIDGWCHHSKKNVYRTHVYSLRSNSWRRIVDCPCGDDWRGLKGPGGFLSGALHWMSWDKIIALDLETENYCQLRLPPFREREKMVIGANHFDVLGGCLMVSDYGKDNHGFAHFDVWVMKDYGAEDSWMKLFSVEERRICYLGHTLRPVAYMKNKMQVVLQDNMGFFLFDVESNSVKMVSIRGLTGILSAQIVPGSIFRLHDNCGVGGSVTTQRRRIMKRKDKMKMSDTELTFCVRDAHCSY